MKIAYILPSLRNQGPIVVTKNIVDFLVDWGHEPEVFYLDETSSKMNFKCPVKHIKMGAPIDFDCYDIIHSHCFRPDIYVWRWRRCICKAKTVSTLHQDTYLLFRDQYNLVLAWTYARFWNYVQSRFNGVISISDTLKQAYLKHIKAPITTLHNGCAVRIDGTADKGIVEVLTKTKSTYRLLGAYAFIVPCKGLNQVIQALPHLREYAFVVIGEGPEVSNLKQLSHELGVADRTLFFPYQKTPYNYLPYFDVYMMPSYSEGFGMAMVEAALAGKSIVCSDIPVFHEIFSEEEVCYFTLDDTASLCNSIQLAYENRVQLGAAASIKANGEFTAERMAKKHVEYYQNLIKLH